MSWKVPGVNPFIALGLALALTASILGPSLRRAVRLTPGWIVRHRLISDGATYRVRVGGTTATWNPDVTARERMVFGPATGVYRRENSPDGDLIHLELTPEVGPVRHFTGPVPVFEVPRTPENRRARRRRRLVRSLLGVPLVLGFSGSGLGWWLSEGKSHDLRSAAAIGGFFGGFLVMNLVILAGFVGNSVRRTIRGSDLHEKA